MQLHASLEDVVFLHFIVDPSDIRSRLPPGLSLDLPLCSAWITLMAWRSRGPAPLPAGLLRGVPSCAQFALRTYVVDGDQPAIYTLDQVVSSAPVAAAARLLGMHPRTGSVRVRREGERIDARLGGSGGDALALRVRISGPPAPAADDMISRRLLNRQRLLEGTPPRAIVLEHSPWEVQPLAVELLEASALLPASARLAAAHLGAPQLLHMFAPPRMASLQNAAFSLEPA